ncbi:MAG: rod shape-determining protein MreC [Ruminococcaceae bacterium]|nr:rod shape-determining protein MreC [Oscillospiraceae bacterium]
MKHLLTGRVRIILIVAVLLAASLAILSNALDMNLPTMLTNAVLAPIRYGATALTDQAEQWYSYMFRYEAVAAENESLREQIANMEDEARRADAVERENQRLRDLLNLKSTHEDYELVDAYIIGWDSTDWTNSVIVNRGSDAGIEEGMCAITANGQVVGLVVEVGPNYAEVKTILDSTLEISCVIASSGYNGMSKGGYYYKDINHLKLDYLPSSAVIRNKDAVVTSGSTVYPRDLIVGYVVDAGFDDTGVAKFAVLEPAAEIASLEQIFILTNYTTE